MVFALVIGLPAGIFAAVKRGTFVDQGTMGLSLVGYSMPIFWWGLLLIILFSSILGLTPVSGRLSFMFEVSRTRFPWTQNWLNRSVQGGPEHDRQF